ncbi:hypothetical protein H0R92_00010 [Treponema sp. OMZ 840]|uniref:hypothetical protein n=1 Tax=Treponema sp. OMZ 840 TaxID=244313 RepID=UPI003D90007A
MKIREKTFIVLICIPCFIIIFFAVKFNNTLLLLISLILIAFLTFLGGLIYDYYILDFQSTSFLYAGREALKRGYDPRVQKGTYLDPEKYSVSEIYNSFPLNRSALPMKGTAGLMFTTYAKGKKSNKVEFYIYNSNDDCFLYWQFFFDVYETKRDFTREKKMQLVNIPKNKVFIVLKPRSYERIE